MSAKKSKIKIILKTRRIEFTYNDQFYTYEYRSDSSSGFAFIFKGGEKIYGPYIGQQTEEGVEVFNAITKKLKDESKI